MKVFDVFLFNNELDLLEIRLNVLNEYVDYFVISESETTFSGEKKELYYEKNKHLFKKFENKIIHNIITEPTQQDLDLVSILYDIKNYRTYQEDAYQKDSIKLILDKICSDEDIIIWSDLDEIPNPKSINAVLNSYDSSAVYNFAQDNFQGYLNLIEITGTVISQTPDNDLIWPKWIGTKILSYFILKKYTLTQIRRPLNENNIRIYPGGWHWSTVGSHNKSTYEERVVNKIKKAAHFELNNEYYLNMVSQRIKENRSPFGQDAATYKKIDVCLENNYPEYLIENIDKYKYLIKD